MKIGILIAFLFLSGCGLSQKEKLEIVAKTAGEICQEGSEIITLRTDGVVEFTCKPKKPKTL